MIMSIAFVLSLLRWQAQAGQDKVNYSGPASMEKPPIVKLKLDPVPVHWPINRPLKLVVRNEGSEPAAVRFSVEERDGTLDGRTPLPKTRGDQSPDLFAQEAFDYKFFLIKPHGTLRINWMPVGTTRWFSAKAGQGYVVLVTPISADTYGWPLFRTNFIRFMPPQSLAKRGRRRVKTHPLRS